MKIIPLHARPLQNVVEPRPLFNLLSPVFFILPFLPSSHHRWIYLNADRKAFARESSLLRSNSTRNPVTSLIFLATRSKMCWAL